MTHLRPVPTPRGSGRPLPSAAARAPETPAGPTPADRSPNAGPASPALAGPAAHEPITEDQALAHLHATCLTSAQPARCGVELEWLVHDLVDATRRVTVAPRLATTAAVRFGRLTVEPGGQLEYSSAPAAGLSACVASTLRDMATLRTAAHAEGVRLVGLGIDPYREPRRMLNLPRYAAMERFFDRDGSAGRWMMCATASVQVCLDAGGDDRAQRRRWALAHAVGPVLVAAFANSAVARSRPTGWASARQSIWSRIDRGRTSPVLPGDPGADGDSPADQWARYAMDAQVLCVRREGGLPWTAPHGLTFRRWVLGGGDRRPTLADLDYHLSTLFPPVRPRGYLELRMIDAQRADGWTVPAAVCATLLDDPAAGDAALAATEPLWAAAGRRPDGPARLWRRAAQQGLRDTSLAKAAVACFDAVTLALPAGRLRSAVQAFTERYPRQGRCPADDVLAGYLQATTRLIA